MAMQLRDDESALVNTVRRFGMVTDPTRPTAVFVAPRLRRGCLIGLTGALFGCGAARLEGDWLFQFDGPFAKSGDCDRNDWNEHLYGSVAGTILIEDDDDVVLTLETGWVPTTDGGLAFVGFTAMKGLATGRSFEASREDVRENRRWVSTWTGELRWGQISGYAFYAHEQDWGDGDGYSCETIAEFWSAGSRP